MTTGIFSGIPVAGMPLAAWIFAVVFSTETERAGDNDR